MPLLLVCTHAGAGFHEVVNANYGEIIVDNHMVWNWTLLQAPDEFGPEQEELRFIIVYYIYICSFSFA